MPYFYIPIVFRVIILEEFLILITKISFAAITELDEMELKSKIKYYMV